MGTRYRTNTAEHFGLHFRFVLIMTMSNGNRISDGILGKLNTYAVYFCRYEWQRLINFTVLIVNLHLCPPLQPVIEESLKDLEAFDGTFSPGVFSPHLHSLYLSLSLAHPPIFPLIKSEAGKPSSRSTNLFQALSFLCSPPILLHRLFVSYQIPYIPNIINQL